MDDLDLDTEGMSQYNPYEDELKNVDTFLSLNEDPEVTLEWGDQY